MVYCICMSKNLSNIPNNYVDLDMLTFKLKCRRVQPILYTFDEEFCEQNPVGFSSMKRSIVNKGNKRICKACKGPTRWCCKVCKGYYSCGSLGCHTKAWKMHKVECSFSSQY